MNAPMTLREAVEIVALSRGQFAVTAECEISGDAHLKFKKKAVREACAKWDRARAIVDAMADLAHYRLAQFGFVDEITYQQAMFHEGKAIEKLRALERGEGETKQ